MRKAGGSPQKVSSGSLGSEGQVLTGTVLSNVLLQINVNNIQNTFGLYQATSLSSQLSKFEDKKRKHVQTLERKTSNMKQMFKKGKGKIIPLLIG